MDRYGTSFQGYLFDCCPTVQARGQEGRRPRARRMQPTLALSIEQGLRDVLRMLAGSEIIIASPDSDFQAPNRPPSVTSYRFSSRQSPFGTIPHDQVSQPISARCNSPMAHR
jgi:hypothetical protein